MSLDDLLKKASETLKKLKELSKEKVEIIPPEEYKKLEEIPKRRVKEEELRRERILKAAEEHRWIELTEEEKIEALMYQIPVKMVERITVNAFGRGGVYRYIQFKPVVTKGLLKQARRIKIYATRIKGTRGVEIPKTFYEEFKEETEKAWRILHSTSNQEELFEYEIEKTPIIVRRKYTCPICGYRTDKEVIVIFKQRCPNCKVPLSFITRRITDEDIVWMEYLELNREKIENIEQFVLTPKLPIKPPISEEIKEVVKTFPIVEYKPKPFPIAEIKNKPSGIVIPSFSEPENLIGEIEGFIVEFERKILEYIKETESSILTVEEKEGAITPIILKTAITPYEASKKLMEVSK